MFNRYTGKAWDKRFLPRLNKVQVAELPKDRAVVVLPIGATEQHGPHLPAFTDTLIGEGFLTYAFEELPEEEHIWLLPALPFGKSSEHLGHSGTVTFSASTMMSMLMDIAKSLKASGFQKLVLFSTHGGNVDVLNMMARDIRIETGLAVFRLDPGFMASEGIISAEEQAVGIHGGEAETSQVLWLKPNWVDMEAAPSEIPNYPQGEFLQFKKKAFAWVVDDLSHSGISGNAKQATIETGRKIFENGGKLIARGLLEIARFDMASVKVPSLEVK
ncbi:creatininase family protein [Paenibacillus sp. y28]|uniref:creatininase family protein n=1 Tax=Paenibacillus sp. y28 TaxID=3129110 RepID=UPI003019D39F